MSTLSVIVASYNSHSVLRRCLESLCAQPEAREIVVADCSPLNPAIEMAPMFPKVRFLHFADRKTVPQLRWAAYRETSGEIVAATEGRCVPERDWCFGLLRAHREAPEAPGVGGPITIQPGSSAFEIGLYFCEYGWHSPPITERRVLNFSGANASYKRRALEQARDLVDASAWETQFHLRWREQGLPLHMSSALVIFYNVMNVATAMRQRFTYGRGYGADRLAGSGWGRRLAYAGFAIPLPGLLTWRLARLALRKGRLTEFLRGFFWVVILSSTWSTGEMTGYLMGASRHTEIY